MRDKERHGSHMSELKPTKEFCNNKNCGTSTTSREEKSF